MDSEYISRLSVSNRFHDEVIVEHKLGTTDAERPRTLALFINGLAVTWKQDGGTDSWPTDWSEINSD